MRSWEDLKTLYESQPFKKIPVTKLTRLYVTFLSEKPKTAIKIPYVSPGKEFRILSASPTEVISVLTITDRAHTPDAMKILEQTFGKNVTTRNWNTVEKLVQV